MTKLVGVQQGVTITMCVALLVLISCGSATPARAQYDKGKIDLQIPVGFPVMLGALADNNENDPFYVGNSRIFGGYGLGVCVTSAVEIGAFIDAAAWSGGTLTVSVGGNAQAMDYNVATGGIFARYFILPHDRFQPYGELILAGSFLQLDNGKSAADSHGYFDYGLGAGVMYVPSRHIALSAALQYRHGTVAGIGVPGPEEENVTTRTLIISRVIPHVALHVMLL